MGYPKVTGNGTWSLVNIKECGHPTNGRTVLIFGRIQGIHGTTCGTWNDGWYRYDGLKIHNVKGWANLPKSPWRDYW